MNYEEAKKLISEAKNICLLPSENEPESLTSLLALFYTLRELGKNVNVIFENFPENLNFLIPSIDAMSTPKNFVISIPRSTANVSQIYYEKTDESLNIHLTTDTGNIKKENISFYFKEAKPDLIITLKIRDFREYLESKLDSFGFLLGSPILNIDNSQENSRFGQIDIIEQKSLSEIIMELIKSIDENLINRNIANCLLSGLTIYYENFKSSNVNEGVFNTAAELIKRGADNRQISDNLYKTTDKEMEFLSKILRNLKKEGGLLVATSELADFSSFSEIELGSIIEKVKTLGIQDDLLVLWSEHNSDPIVRGFFYSKNNSLLNKIADVQKVSAKNNWVFLQIPGDNIVSLKEKIIMLLKEE